MTAAPPDLVDVHTHVVPEAFPAYLGTRLNVPWPSMVPAQPCHAHVMVSGQVYRTVSHQCWSCSVRLADMDTQRVTRQVLSPMPELLSYWLEADDGAVLARHLNETIAAMVNEAPQRFAGLASVPLQDVATAIAELDHAVNTLGLAGVEIGTNVNGDAIGAPTFLPFFEAAAAWGAAVFVHPLRPSGMDRLVGPATLEQVLAFPGEAGLAAASLLTGGTLAKLPNLRVALSHGGGTLALLLPRLRHAWRCIPPVRDTLADDPLRLAQRFYVDDLVYDADTIHHLIRTFGEGQVLVGSDYPFLIMDRDPAGRLDSLGLSADVLQRLRSDNARRWLGEAESPT